MASVVDAAGDPIPTSAVVMSSSKHIANKCRSENVAVAYPPLQTQGFQLGEMLNKGHQVTRCVLSLVKDLHQRCTKEPDAHVGCMYYHTNEFDLYRKEQEVFEKACPLE
ncbi:unnamed protein product [Citrullus colocynthis]|uniref:Uncharacterized protein n=1 Tax=Citrullus colocynthis TaxID=252529 RepID=A0ABP0ZCG3_9ROSI